MQLLPLTDILHKRMSRKDFLRTISLAALAFVGLGFLIRNPGAVSSQGAVQSEQHNDAYGK